MKHFVFMLTVFFVFSTTGQVFAENSLDKAALKIETGILNILNGLGNTLSLVAKEIGRTGPDKETEIRKLLQKNCNAGRPYVIDSTFIDSKGIMKIIEPAKYRRYEGSDISKQEAVMKMLKTKKPRMGNVFLSVEGIKSIDIEYPVFSKENHFLGSVSMLVMPDGLIRSVAAPIEKDMGVKCMVMQKDGLILYDTDTEQIGLNTFQDPLFKDHPALIALAKRMVKEKKGTGFYNFQVRGTEKVVRNRAVWKTAHFFQNDWIVVAYREVK